MGKDNKDKRMYWVWSAIIQRCTNPNCKAYKNYGGRGISVCKEWRDFKNFIADVGEKPSPSHTLDRIDNDKGYFKSNVRWATRKEQVENRRTRKDEIVYKGETATQASIRLTGGKYKRLVSRRIKELGWGINKAFTEPHGKKAQAEARRSKRKRR